MNIQQNTQAATYAPQKPQQAIRQQDIKNSPESDVLRIASKQFTFSSGLIMAKITDRAVTNKFGLQWHAANSGGSVDRFIESVATFIAVGGFKMTEQDENKLRTAFATYIK